MKITAIIVLALALKGCHWMPPTNVDVFNIGEFPIFETRSISVTQGEYQAGIEVYGEGNVSFTASGGILVNGETTHTVNKPGEYWLIISTGAMDPGDVGIIESTRTTGSYYPEQTPDIETAALEIEIEL